ncbi:MAG: hypothetical protein ABIO94_09700 [Opitutaceae bacterium]
MTRQPATETAAQRDAKIHSRPVTTFRLGRIKAAVWENPSEQKMFYNVTFSRSYVDEEKRFHDANSFGRDDLPLVAKLADEAHTFIFKRLAAKKTEEQG